MLHALIATALIVVTACTATPAVQPTDPASRTTSTPSPQRDVVVHLFQWNWKSVAAACPDLAKMGYGGVQISPPQEHAIIAGNPWYEDYQPVSYQLTTRRGDEAALKNMVQTCHAAGIRIYADVVINHMIGGDSAVGWAGTKVTHYDYPGLYTPADFHHCGLTSNDDIVDYENPDQLRNCELLDLADLATEKEPVRTTIASYLNHLLDLGFDGFRVDAAKHIPPTDLVAIWAKLHRRPDTYQEVIDTGSYAFSMSDYLATGRVTVFSYGAAVGQAVQWDKVSDLKTLGGGVASKDAQVFIDNHDTQRHGSTSIVTHVKRTDYALANVIMLGWDYGTPVVMSSFDAPANSPLVAEDMGPPALDAKGTTKDTVCGSDGWVCEHAWPAIAGMVAFHNDARGASVDKWWDDGNNTIAWARGDRGFVIVANGDAVPSRSWQTGMPAGTYCDIISGGLVAGACVGQRVDVDASGTFTTGIPARTALAISRATKAA